MVTRTPVIRLTQGGAQVLVKLEGQYPDVPRNRIVERALELYWLESHNGRNQDKA